jgi:hypothetical protein
LVLIVLVLGGIGIGQYWYWVVLVLVSIGIGRYLYWSVLVLVLVDVGIGIWGRWLLVHHLKTQTLYFEKPITDSDSSTPRTYDQTL